MMSSISSAEFENCKSDFFSNKKLCDVTLTDGSGEVQVMAHRSVLSAKSEYFSSMFGGFFKEANSSEVKLDEIDGRTLERVINFIYSNKIELEDNTVEDFLKAANFLQINPLEEECSDYLRKQLDVSNVLSIVFFAEQYSPSYLYDFAFEFACQHFMKLRATEEFFSLDIHQLDKLISSDNICVSSEEEVFHAIWGWIQHDRHNREQLFEELLQHLRFDLLSAEFISSTVHSAMKSTECKEFISNAFKRQLLVPEHTTKRRSLKGTLIFIGRLSGTIDLTIKCYSPALNECSYRKCPGTLIEERTGFGGTILDEKLYMAGGSLRHEKTNRVDCLDLKTFQWTQLPPLLKARSWCGMTTLHGHLYVAGGIDPDHEGLTSVEKWDPLIGKWEYIAPMSSAVRWPIVGVKGSSLCVARDNCYGERILDIYNPLTKEWTYEWSRAKHPLLGMATVPINGVDHFFTISNTEIKSYNLKTNNTRTIPVYCVEDLFLVDFALFNCSFITLTDIDSCYRKYCPIKNEWVTLPNLDTKPSSQLVLISPAI